MFELLIVKS